MVKRIGIAGYEFPCLRFLEGIDDFLIRRICFAPLHIAANRAGNQGVLLQNDADVFAQCMKGIVFHIISSDKNGTLIDVI